MPSPNGPYRDAESHLADHVKRIALRLDHHAIARQAARIAAREAVTSIELPLRRLQLDATALDILVALALPYLDGPTAAAYVERTAGLSPVVDGLVELLAQSDEAALRAAVAHDAPLVTSGLVQLEGGASTPHGQHTLAIDDRVVAFMRGDDAIDHRVRDVVAMRAGGEADPRIVELLATRGPLVIEGPARVGKTTAAVAACGKALVADLERLVTDDDPIATFRRVRREAVLQGVTLVLRAATWDETWPAKLRRELVDAIQTRAAIVTVRNADVLCRVINGPRRVAIAMPSREAQRKQWTAAVGVEVGEDIVAKYPLPPGDIAVAAAAARARAEVAMRAPTDDDVRAAARDRLAHRLGDVAELVTTTLSWSDLVLRDDVMARVREMVGAVQFRERVMEEWGFAAKVPYGRSISALFSGPPGTGKTMVATLIGKELGLEVFRVDLSKIVSKFIGETEKNLARVFEEASRCNAVLLFDEADSLFAKRTAVATSNDRYANLEVNFLLQRLEAHAGIVILTTNAARSIDQAFLRRLRFRVEFAEPDEHERAQLWRAMMPPAAPIADDVDCAVLGRQFRLTGGHIKNAVVRAAFLAMSEGRGEIDQQTLVRSATLEWTELGHLATEPVAKPRAEPFKPSIYEPPANAKKPPPVPTVEVAFGVEAAIARVLAEAPRPGETIEVAYTRKERELGGLFASLGVLESRTLHARLSRPEGATPGCDLARLFQRLSPDRRKRLLDFLLDARRRDAVKSRSAKKLAS